MIIPALFISSLSLTDKYESKTLIYYTSDLTSRYILNNEASLQEDLDFAIRRGGVFSYYL